MNCSCQVPFVTRRVREACFQKLLFALATVGSTFICPLSSYPVAECETTPTAGVGRLIPIEVQPKTL